MPRKLVPRYRRGIRDHIGHLIYVPCCAGIENFIISGFSSFALAGGRVYQRPGSETPICVSYLYSLTLIK